MRPFRELGQICFTFSWSHNLTPIISKRKRRILDKSLNEQFFILLIRDGEIQMDENIDTDFEFCEVKYIERKRHQNRAALLILFFVPFLH